MTTRDRAQNAPTPSVQTDSAAGNSTHLYHPSPQAVLPDTDTIRRVTRLDVRPVNGALVNTVVDDSPTTPSSCALADNPATVSAWAQATSTAGKQLWSVASDHPEGDGVGVALAVFDGEGAATSSLGNVSTSVTGCPTYGAPTNDPRRTANVWTISDVRKYNGLITWTGTQQAGSEVWKCGYTYRVVANLAAVAIVCSRHPAESSTRLADVLISNAIRR